MVWNECSWNIFDPRDTPHSFGLSQSPIIRMLNEETKKKKTSDHLHSIIEIDELETNEERENEKKNNNTNQAKKIFITIVFLVESYSSVKSTKWMNFETNHSEDETNLYWNKKNFFISKWIEFFETNIIKSNLATTAFLFGLQLRNRPQRLEGLRIVFFFFFC